MVVAADNAPANQPADMKNTFKRQVVGQKAVALLAATEVANLVATVKDFLTRRRAVWRPLEPVDATLVDLLHATVLAEHRAAPIATTSACQSFALTGVDLNSLRA